jgi:hypothetical protein
MIDDPQMPLGLLAALIFFAGYLFAKITDHP